MDGSEAFFHFLKGIKCGVLSQTRYVFKSDRSATLINRAFSVAPIIMIDKRTETIGGIALCKVPAFADKQLQTGFYKSIGPENAGTLLPFLRELSKSIEFIVISSDCYRLWSAYQNDRKKIQHNLIDIEPDAEPRRDGPSEFTVTAFSIAGEWIGGIIAGKTLSVIYCLTGAIIGIPFGETFEFAFESAGYCLGAYQGGILGTTLGGKLGKRLAHEVHRMIADPVVVND